MAEVAGNSVLPVDRTVPFQNRPGKLSAQEGVACYACPGSLRSPAGRSAQNEHHCTAQRKYTASFIHDLCPVWYPDGGNKNDTFAAVLGDANGTGSHRCIYRRLTSFARAADMPKPRGPPAKTPRPASLGSLRFYIFSISERIAEGAIPHKNLGNCPLKAARGDLSVIGIDRRVQMNSASCSPFKYRRARSSNLR
jgi:hypothetical protein